MGEKRAGQAGSYTVEELGDQVTRAEVLEMVSAALELHARHVRGYVDQRIAFHLELRESMRRRRRWRYRLARWCERTLRRLRGG